MIKFGEYAPDRVAGIDTVMAGKNLYPCANGDYGYVHEYAAVVSAVNTRVQGAVYAVDKDYNVSAYCGTSTKLYKLVAGGTSFSDVSKAAGYTTGAAETWEFAQFNQRLIASNFAEPIQTYTLGVSALFADLSAGAPKARHIGVVNRFLMAGNTYDGSGGNQPARLWWSAIDDPTNWPTPATSSAAAVQSGYVDIFGSTGAVQSIAPRIGMLDAIIVMERGLLRCQYVGSPEVFTFQPLEGGRGTPAPNSVTPYGGILYYLGEDGFYACNGATSMPIGAGKVDDTFWEDVNENYLNRVVGVFDPVNHLWMVGYPNNDSSDGTVNRILTYNVVTQRWAPPWHVSIEWITKLGSVGYTLEQLDSFGTVETITSSFDSRQWTGSARPSLSAFNTSHQLGYFTGQIAEAVIETGDSDGATRIMTKHVRPFLSYRQQQGSPVVTCRVGYRDNLHDDVNYTAYQTLNRYGVAPIRANGRHVRACIKVAAGGVWEHIVGFDFDQAGGGTL